MAVASSSNGSSSFATFLIVGPTCFFLGVLFSLFPYDYHVLWATPSAAAPRTAAQYFDILEAHLRFIHASPPLIPRILHIAIATGLLGFLTKLYRPSESNLLFDGASLVLYMVGVMVYVSNTVKGLRIVTGGTYGAEGSGTADAVAEGVETVGREDSLRVMAASNTILALVLVGVLVLQAGQWYAAKKEERELEEMERAEREGEETKKKSRASGKKRQ